MVKNRDCPAKKPIKVVFACFEHEQSKWAQDVKEWAMDLERRTDGRVRVEFSWAGAIGNPADFDELLVKGVCDAVQLVPSWQRRPYPLSEILSLHWNIPSAQIGTKALLEFAKKGYLDEDFADMEILTLNAWTGSVLFTVDKPVTTLEDVKGLKLHAGTRGQHDRFSAMGAVPVNLTDPRIMYPAYQKGEAQGTTMVFGIMFDFRVHELCKYVTEPGVGSNLTCTVINKDFLHQLPADIQATMKDMVEPHSINHARAFDKHNTTARQAFLEAGGQIFDWEPDALAKMEELFAPLWEEWIADKEAKGLPATQAVDDFYNLLKGLGVERPAIGYKPGSEAGTTY